MEVIPTACLNSWSTKKARAVPTRRNEKRGKRTQSLPIPPAHWKTKRIIAYPVHSPGHWTLGILVNKLWQEQGENWVAYHFDSFKCNEYALPTALAFGQYVTGIRHRCDLPIKEVPVPQQRAGSNDCGLWTAHYLKIFLKDIDFFIDFCNLVCIWLVVKTINLSHCTG